MRFGTVMLLACLMAGSCWGQQNSHFTSADAFGTLPRMSDVTLSFDGKFAAWLDFGSSPQRIIVFDLVNNRDARVFEAPGDTQLREVLWADNDTLLYSVSTTYRLPRDSRVTYEILRTFSADLMSGKTHMFFGDSVMHEFVTSSKVLLTHTSKPSVAIVESLDGTNAFFRMVSSVFEVDTRTGNSKLIERGTSLTQQWVIDADGKPVARSEFDASEKQYRVLARDGAGWKPIYERADGRQLHLFSVSADRKAIVCLGADAEGKSRLLSLPLDGSPPSVVYEDATRDVVGVIIDRNDHRLLGIRLGGVAYERVWLDPAAQKRALGLQKSFPGMAVDVLDHSDDGLRQLVAVFTPNKPFVYHVVDYAAHKADILGEAYPALAGVKLGEAKSITYQARDGAEIPAFLTFPPDYKGDGAISMVVLPHDGPVARDYHVFNWLAQFVASRGFIVLQPQFRGSSGFGEKFQSAGIRQWGKLMQDDVTDGVNAMIALHLADPSRICIVGIGYGGFVALAGATFNRKLYACAVSINGVSDLPKMLLYEKTQGASAVSYWREHIGSITDPDLEAKSPARHAFQVSSPVLLITSSDDTIVPSEQTLSMDSVLRLAQKSVTTVKIAGDDHWLWNTAPRRQVVAELDKFLEEKLAR